jgi:hypothetical protein
LARHQPRLRAAVGKMTARKSLHQAVADFKSLYWHHSISGINHVLGSA